MSLEADTELRIALIAALEADAGVIAAMGGVARAFDVVPPGTPFPYLIVSTSNLRPWDTTTEWGAEIDAEIRYKGEPASEGKEEGESIFRAIRVLLRDAWAPRTLVSAHRLINLTFAYSDVRPDEDRRFMGLQRWRAVTEEI